MKMKGNKKNISMESLGAKLDILLKWMIITNKKLDYYHKEYVRLRSVSDFQFKRFVRGI